MRPPVPGPTLHAPSKQALAERLQRLSPREREVLDEMAQGASNKAIAHKLGISEGTVKMHVLQVLHKLHLTSRVQTAALAHEPRQQAPQHDEPAPDDPAAS